MPREELPSGVKAPPVTHAMTPGKGRLVTAATLYLRSLWLSVHRAASSTTSIVHVGELSDTKARCLLGCSMGSALKLRRTDTSHPTITYNI